MSDRFFENVARIIEQARKYVGRTADLTMCVAYFEIGRMIIEEEQGGEARAKYGHDLLGELSAFLGKRFGKGYSVSTLTSARKFYQTYAPSISQTMFAKLSTGETSRKSQTMFAKLSTGETSRKSQTMFAKLSTGETSRKSQTMFAFFDSPQENQSYPFTLSWSHYLILMRIKDEQARRFYEIESFSQQWTFRQLKRQYNSSLYERLALSRDKDEVMRLAIEGQTIEKSQDILKDPLVLEFLDLEQTPSYSESNLESAIIANLQKFLLELGKGFLFEARQKRFTFDEKSFFVDLVLYNRLLQCYVLIDLKTGELHHQDLGQMQMYVHYFDRYVKKEFEKPTVGILLCQEKNDNIVELTLSDDSNIYASEYSLYLPDKSLLQRKLAEWIEEFEDAKAIRESANGGKAE